MFYFVVLFCFVCVWLTALWYQLSSERSGHYFLLPGIGYIACDHWGTYTLHMFKFNIEELKPPKWLQSTWVCEYALVILRSDCLSYPPWISWPTVQKMYHSVNSRQLILVKMTHTCGEVPSRQKKMSKREMKWPPSSRWTWLNQQWKSMSWKKLAGKINEGIMQWPMNFLPFCILSGCSNLNIQIYLFQIILAFSFLFHSQLPLALMLLYLRLCAQLKASTDAAIVTLFPQTTSLGK